MFCKIIIITSGISMNFKFKISLHNLFKTVIQNSAHLSRCALHSPVSSRFSSHADRTRTHSCFVEKLL